MTIFEAGFQYNDLEGIVKTDRDDHQTAADYLKKNKKIPENGFLFGIKIYSSVHNVREKTLAVRFLHSDVAGYDNIQDKMRVEGDTFSINEVEIEMPYYEFFGLFKRFSLTLSPNNLLEGKPYRVA
ncbi:hypothetical protein BZG05_08565 [Salinivibrio kushneri]|uniref:hypothetical protein n=1 Tax=Salinivibrio kushneri TaxID=1908198 RepID=UPI000988AEEF|nr:hypothetical protein [Salinivibrio kushneri]OOE34053.1 hypothetical protein BZG05_08565 [Salinivibrio kushneri]OOE52655.1 hypothetical protein BZG11_04510 [Salinivibrio kushneri]